MWAATGVLILVMLLLLLVGVSGHRIVKRHGDFLRRLFIYHSGNDCCNDCPEMQPILGESEGEEATTATLGSIVQAQAIASGEKPIAIAVTVELLWQFSEQGG